MRLYLLCGLTYVFDVEVGVRQTHRSPALRTMNADKHKITQLMLMIDRWIHCSTPIHLLPLRLHFWRFLSQPCELRYNYCGRKDYRIWYWIYVLYILEWGVLSHPQSTEQPNTVAAESHKFCLSTSSRWTAQPSADQIILGYALLSCAKSHLTLSSTTHSHTFHCQVVSQAEHPFSSVGPSPLDTHTHAAPIATWCFLVTASA